MPEVVFRVRWPDGTVQGCYSPSTVVEDYFDAGADYSVEEFLSRSRQSLTAASERVRRIHGFACSQAVAQLADIERRAAAFPAADARVVMEGFQR